MKEQNKIVLIMAFALLPLGLRAQELEPQMLRDQRTSPPPILNGQGPSLAFQYEKIHTNYLSGGISFSDAFTDNATLSNTDPVNDFSYLVQPHISFSQTTARMNWDLNVGAGLIVDQHLHSENQFAKSVSLDLTYRLSSHVNLRLSDTFTDTTGLFSVSNPGTLGSSISVVEQSNNSVLVPLVQRTLANASFAEMSYRPSPSSTVGLRGTFSILDYPGSSQNAEFGPLYDTQTYLVEAFYNYQMSPKQWVGVALRTQRFDTSVATTDTATLLFHYSVKTAPDVTLSFFAGPEYYNTPRISDSAATIGTFQGHQWTSAEGVTLSWQRERTSVAATYSRQLSDGGGLYSAVTLELANASLRRQLGRGLEVQLGFTYTSNDPLSSGSNYRGISSLCEFRQSFGRSFLFRVGYAHQRQEWPGSRSLANANLAWISVSYSFSHYFGSGASTKPAGRLPL
jgi:hypothetical protein